MNELLCASYDICDMRDASTRLATRGGAATTLARAVEDAMLQFIVQQPYDVLAEAYASILRRSEDGDMEPSRSLSLVAEEMDRRRGDSVDGVADCHDDTQFTFLIPVKPKALSTDWSLVEANLLATVRSVLASRDGRFRILIASHDPLNLPADARIEHHLVDFDHATEVVRGLADKQRKLRHLAAQLRQRQYRGYIMPLDADDLVSNRLTEYVLLHDNGMSYLMRQGYRFDVTNGKLRVQPDCFDKSCGSCFVGYFEPEELPVDAGDRKNYFAGFMRHTECLEIASAHGRAPTPVPFPAIVYVINHADSLRMARLEGKVRAVAENMALGDGDTILRDEFSFLLAAADVD